MTTHDLSGFEPALAMALAAMVEAGFGPGFDLDDVRAVLGTDLTMTHASVTSPRFESAKSAATAAVRSLPTNFDGLRRVQGVVACVMVGTPALALAAVKTVTAQLRGEGSEDMAVICGACVDPAMGKSIKVMLWTK